MKILILTMAIWCGAAAAFAGKISFDNVAPGELPPGWTAGITGDGKADWAVVEDASAPSAGHHALKQSGAAKFCWCVTTNVVLQHGWIETKFKPLTGKEDESGGLIWRWRDGNNYYVARANALEDNVTIYHTVDGVRKEYGRRDIKVASNQWHTLRVEFHGNHFKVIFDGKLALQWDDETFKDAGAVGVWTKADSVTLFDDFRWKGHLVSRQ
jgi:hypothetical protein